MKSEKLFHSVFGKRLTERRIEKGLSVIDLFALMRNLSTADSAQLTASDCKTIYNWQQGKSTPDLEDFGKLCTILDCSADYLLGIDKCSNKDNQYISDTTGLSENSIERLKYCLKRANDSGDYAQEYERNCIDSFNQVFSRIHLMGFCKDLLTLAKEKSAIAPSQKYWDEYNVALEKGKKPKKRPQSVLPYSKCNAERQQQLVEKYKLEESLTDMLNLLSESLTEFPIE